MELMGQILFKIIRDKIENGEFLTEEVLEEMFEKRCYQALRDIREIIMDEDLEDEECFERIEAIVCLFEEMDSNGGDRHDF